MPACTNSAGVLMPIGSTTLPFQGSAQARQWIEGVGAPALLIEALCGSAHARPWAQAGEERPLRARADRRSVEDRRGWVGFLSAFAALRLACGAVLSPCSAVRVTVGLVRRRGHRARAGRNRADRLTLALWTQSPYRTRCCAVGPQCETRRMPKATAQVCILGESLRAKSAYG